MMLMQRLVLFTLIVAVVASAAGPKISHANAAGLVGKELIGKWEGTMTSSMGVANVRLDLRADGNKIAGELNTQHGDWPITDVKLADGKWNIAWRTPENAAGTLIGTLKGDKLEGNYDFPPNFSGPFSFTRAKAAEK
jgi:hypothetical protein